MQRKFRSRYPNELRKKVLIRTANQRSASSWSLKNLPPNLEFCAIEALIKKSEEDLARINQERAALEIRRQDLLRNHPQLGNRSSPGPSNVSPDMEIDFSFVKNCKCNCHKKEGSEPVCKLISMRECCVFMSSPEIPS